MAQKTKATPFRWSMALISALIGATIALVVMAVPNSANHSAPVISYVIVGLFGGCFAFLVYLARNNEVEQDATQIYDPAIGDIGDYNAGRAGPLMGNIGHAVKALEDDEEAARRHYL